MSSDIPAPIATFLTQSKAITVTSTNLSLNYTFNAGQFSNRVDDTF